MIRESAFAVFALHGNQREWRRVPIDTDGWDEERARVYAGMYARQFGRCVSVVFADPLSIRHAFSFDRYGQEIARGG
jgi:hypothetical protein